MKTLTLSHCVLWTLKHWLWNRLIIGIGLPSQRIILQLNKIMLFVLYKHSRLLKSWFYFVLKYLSVTWLINIFLKVLIVNQYNNLSNIYLKHRYITYTHVCHCKMLHCKRFLKRKLQRHKYSVFWNLGNEHFLRPTFVSLSENIFLKDLFSPKLCQFERFTFQVHLSPSHYCKWQQLLLGFPWPPKTSA